MQEPRGGSSGDVEAQSRRGMLEPGVMGCRRLGGCQSPGDGGVSRQGDVRTRGKEMKELGMQDNKGRRMLESGGTCKSPGQPLLPLCSLQTLLCSSTPGRQKFHQDLVLCCRESCWVFPLCRGCPSSSSVASCSSIFPAKAHHCRTWGSNDAQAGSHSPGQSQPRAQQLLPMPLDISASAN